MDTIEKELAERFKAIEKESNTNRLAIIRAAFVMRDAKELAVQSQEFGLAARLRDRSLDLLRLLD